MNKIYSVKQASKIIGVSTNTMYKYLNEGRIQAARGQSKGSFKIPTKSLEKFLGSPLPEVDLSQTPAKKDSTLHSLNRHPAEPVVIEVTPPTLTVKTTRILLIIALVFIIIDILKNPDFSFSTQIIRLILLGLLSLLAYQFGGFIKR